MRTLIGWMAAMFASALLGAVVYENVLSKPLPASDQTATVETVAEEPQPTPTVYRTEVKTVVEPTPTVTVEDEVADQRGGRPGQPAPDLHGPHPPGRQPRSPGRGRRPSARRTTQPSDDSATTPRPRQRAREPRTPRIRRLRVVRRRPSGRRLRLAPVRPIRRSTGSGRVGRHAGSLGTPPVVPRPWHGSSPQVAHSAARPARSTVIVIARSASGPRGEPARLGHGLLGGLLGGSAAASGPSGAGSRSAGASAADSPDSGRGAPTRPAAWGRSGCGGRHDRDHERRPDRPGLATGASCVGLDPPSPLRPRSSRHPRVRVAASRDQPARARPAAVDDPRRAAPPGAAASSGAATGTPPPPRKPSRTRPAAAAATGSGAGPDLSQSATAQRPGGQQDQPAHEGGDHSGQPGARGGGARERGQVPAPPDAPREHARAPPGPASGAGPHAGTVVGIAARTGSAGRVPTCPPKALSAPAEPRSKPGPDDNGHPPDVQRGQAERPQHGQRQLARRAPRPGRTGSLRSARSVEQGSP